MERLTEMFNGNVQLKAARRPDETYCACPEICDDVENKYGNVECCDNCPVQKAFDRLAAYEDTGLMPDEIPHWIPVSERLPEHSNDVLIYGISNENGEPLILISAYCEKTLGGQFLGSKGWAEPFPYFSHDYTITHWMPLPQPPKEGKS